MAESPLLPLSVLQRLWPQGDKRVPGLVAGLAGTAPDVFAKHDIATPLTVAVMFGQFSHECGAGQEMTENINYTAARACQVWPTRFNSEADVFAKIGSFAGDPDFRIKLMDSVYGDRMGNRPGTHDGSTFIGRGLSQCTGREGYEKVGTATGLDLVNNPDLVNDPAHALECAVADFVLCGCLPFAAQGDVLNTTKRLNGGTIGLAERQQWTAKWQQALGAGIGAAASAPAPQQPTPQQPTPAPAPRPAPDAAPPASFDQQQGGGG